MAALWQKRVDIANTVEWAVGIETMTHFLEVFALILSEVFLYSDSSNMSAIV